jgi:hypothetical protein
VAVHPEERLRDKKATTGVGTEGLETLLRRGKIEVVIEGRSGTGETAGVDDAGVVEMVGKDQVARSGKGGYDTEVGLITRGEEESGFCSNKTGKRRLELAMVGEVPRDQAGSTGSDARAGGGF